MPRAWSARPRTFHARRACPARHDPCGWAAEDLPVRARHGGGPYAPRHDVAIAEGERPAARRQAYRAQRAKRPDERRRRREAVCAEKSPTKRIKLPHAAAPPSTAFGIS